MSVKQDMDAGHPQCPHPFGEHKLCGYEDAIIGRPTGGWTECPVDECYCLTTWGFAGDMINELRARHTDDPRIIDQHRCPDCGSDQTYIIEISAAGVEWRCHKKAHAFVT